jgi:hypothetical protein
MKSRIGAVCLEELKQKNNKQIDIFSLRRVVGDRQEKQKKNMESNHFFMFFVNFSSLFSCYSWGLFSGMLT